MVCRLTWRWLAGILLLWVLPAGAQVAWGDLHADADGLISAGYAGAFGNLQTSDHNLTVGGNGTIKGFYYNPNFLNFSVQPFYDRAQSNAESLNIADNSGYTGNMNLFSGSHFPGTVSFNQEWNGTGTFGIPGQAGLITNTKSHGFGIGWSALLPDLPTLSVGYSQGSTASSLYGSDISTDGSHRLFDVSSAYVVAGFRLNGGFNHVTTDTKINGLLQNGETETSDSSSNLYRLNAVRALPFFNSQLSMGASRGSFSSDFSGGRDKGTTDNANANLTVGFRKVPVNVYANYTDNLFGSIVQQQLGSGQEPTQTFVSPKSHMLTTGGSAFYNVLPRMTVNGFVNHIQEYIDGESFGSTQLGGSVTYSFARRIQGLTFTAGMVDTATQQGNTRIGFIGSADYRRALGRWETDTYFRYNQNVQTLFSIYTVSTMNYGGTVKRNFAHGLRWVGVATGSHSAFQQKAGDSSHGEGFTSIIFWRRMSVSGNYMQSKGTAVLTSGGLVGEPVPGQEIPANNLILFNGKSFGGSVRYNPLRSLGFTGSYARSYSNTTSPTLLSNNASTQVYGLATYRLRKLLFTAGVTNFRQSISTSGTPPGVVTSYYFGVSRWFKGF